MWTPSGISTMSASEIQKTGRRFPVARWRWRAMK
jgi:hypothetical protein